MDFTFTPEQEAWRQEVRDFIKKELTPEMRYSCDGPGRWIGATSGLGEGAGREFQRKLGKKGWIGLTWPKKYGGLERPYLDFYIMDEELTWAGAPIAGMTGRFAVAPTLLAVGTEEQKMKWIPQIASGEIEFCLGYSEPEAGTDLANVQTTAVRDGDEWVINGMKIFNTESHFTEYTWLLAKTDQQAPKHRSLSLFMMPQKDQPGITITPMWTVAGTRERPGRTNLMFIDNVRIPADALVGEKNRGFYYLMIAIDLERIALFQVGVYKPTLVELIEYCKQTKVNGEPLSKDPLVRNKLAELWVEFEVYQALSLRVAWIMDKGIVPNYETSMIKLFASLLQQRLAIAGMEITGHYGLLRAESNCSNPMLRGNLELERMYRCSPHPIFAGGTAAVMQTIISQRGFGLARAY